MGTYLDMSISRLRNTIWGYGTAANDTNYGGYLNPAYASVTHSYMYGGAGNDYIMTLGKEYNHISTGAGNDFVTARDTNGWNAINVVWSDGGVDTVQGGEAADYFYGGLGRGNVAGNGGSDRLYGGIGSNTLSGNDGTDTIQGGISNDDLYGGWGVDSISGGWGADKIYGNENNDHIWGGWGSDLIQGDDGDDRIFAEYDLLGRLLSAKDTVYGGAGDDIIDGGGGGMLAHGGTGSDEIYFRWNDTVHGEYDDDVIGLGYLGAAGKVLKDMRAEIYGGHGADRVSIYSNRNERIEVNLGVGNDFVRIQSQQDNQYIKITGGYGSDTFTFIPAQRYAQLYYSNAYESKLSDKSRDVVIANKGATLGILLEDQNFGKNAFVSHIKEANGWGNLNFVDKNGVSIEILVPNSVSFSWTLI